MNIILFLPYAQALLILSLVGVIVGTIRPGWLLFWKIAPSRQDVYIVCGILFVIGLTSYDMITRKLATQRREQASIPAATQPVALPQATTVPPVQPSAELPVESPPPVSQPAVDSPGTGQPPATPP